MKGDDKVIEVLNEALKHELTAVNQFWLHYRLLENWGYTSLGKKARAESIEEMNHADRLVARIIFLDGHPNLQTLAPLRIGQDIREVLKCDLDAEYEARNLYTDGREVCFKARDYTSKGLLDDLLKDEENHIDFLETQLQLLDTIGVDKYGLLQAEPANKVD